VIHRLTKALCCLALFALSFPGHARAADPNVADTTAMDWSKVPEYRIVPGDKLSINLGLRSDGVTEFIHEVLVRPDGRITVYPVGDVIAAGLTPMELQRSVVGLLSADLRAPRATIEVMSMASNFVHVLGRVERPTQVPAAAFMTVSQAIAGAGGFGPDAARNDVLLIHREGAHSVAVRRLRMDRFLKGESFVDPLVGRFDIIYVPRSTVGNMSAFLQSLFGGIGPAVSTAFVGWELLNLDRVFTTRVIKE
jgi:polysaccharide biosynthesis/export protein PslD